MRKYNYEVTVEDQDLDELKEWCKENGIVTRKKYQRRPKTVDFEMSKNDISDLMIKISNTAITVSTSTPALSISSLIKFAYSSWPSRSASMIKKLSIWPNKNTFCFKTEEDAVAFKLRWL